MPNPDFDWDEWRTHYPTTTYAEQQAFHSRIWHAYPDQRHYATRFVAKAINHTWPTTIIELGGWNGELAATMLHRYPRIHSWTNIELCPEAAQAGRDQHPNYHAPTLTDWYWTQTWQADLLIASHVIEHLRVSELDQMIAATDTPALFFDAPLEDEPSDWTEFRGTHILETGWNGVTAICNNHDYQLTWATTHRTDPHSGDHARACLYTKKGGPQI